VGVRRRVARLERELGGQAFCWCHGARVVYDAATDYQGARPDPGPEVCPECGRPRLTVLVTFDANPREDM